MCDDRRWTRTCAILTAGFVAMALVLGPPALCDDSPRTASYRGLETGDFLKTWLLLGPVAAGEGGDAEAFARDWLSGCGGEASTNPRPEGGCEIDGKEHRWRLVRSQGDVVDLAESLGPKEQSIAYAWAEIQGTSSNRWAFFWKVVNARITFVKDESGKVVKARHRQGGREFEAPRLR